MKLRALLYSGAFVLSLAAASIGSFFYGKHVKAEEERRTYLDYVANYLVMEIQIAAMSRAGEVDKAIRRSEGFMSGDVLVLGMFGSEPNQPPLTKHQLSVLRLAAQYRDLYHPAAFAEVNPYDSSVKPRIDQALDLGAKSGTTEYQWFAAKFLTPRDQGSTSTSPPSTVP